MSPSRPYLLHALYDWILDNNCTPYVAVNAEYEGAIVPKEFVRGGQIILDINPAAVHKFGITNEFMSFSARFSGVSRDLYIPVPAITAIYAKENGAGMVFPINEYDDVATGEGSGSKLGLIEGDDQGGSAASGAGSAGPGDGKPTGKKPNLRIVK